MEIFKKCESKKRCNNTVDDVDRQIKNYKKWRKMFNTLMLLKEVFVKAKTGDKILDKIDDDKTSDKADDKTDGDKSEDKIDDDDDETDYDKTDDEQPDTTNMSNLKTEESAEQRRNKTEQGLKILAPDQMLSRLPITLGQLQAKNNSEEIKN